MKKFLVLFFLLFSVNYIAQVDNFDNDDIRHLCDYALRFDDGEVIPILQLNDYYQIATAFQFGKGLDIEIMIDKNATKIVSNCRAFYADDLVVVFNADKTPKRFYILRKK